MITKLYWTDTDSDKLVTVYFDAVTGLNPEDAVTITDHPVDKGFPVTDGARSQPTRLTIEGIVSLTPNAKLDADVALTKFDLYPVARGVQTLETFGLSVPAPPIQRSESGLLRAGVGAITDALSGAPTAQAWAPGGTEITSVGATALLQKVPRNRIRNMYEILLRAKDQHALITIISAHRDYFDLMIERLAKPQAVGDGSSAKFQLDLKQIRTVTSKSVTAPRPAEPRGNGVVNKGSQSAKPVTDKERRKSIANFLTGYVPRVFLAPGA